MITDRRPERPGLPLELRRLADAVADLHRRTGLPPTLDELADVLGVAKSTVSAWRRRLGALGLLDFDPGSRRSTRITADPALLAAYGLEPASSGTGVRAGAAAPPAPATTSLAGFRSRRARVGGARAGHPAATADGERPWQLPRRPPRSLPVAGQIAAGPARTVLPEEDRIEVDDELAGPGQYALRVRGDSMIGLGVYDGDQAIVDTRQPAHHGDLVAALLPSEHGDEELASLKILELRGDEAWLVAANSAYAPIRLTGCTLLGRVTTIVRRF
jgi:SOS-response transcriptional repressor LexA